MLRDAELGGAYFVSTNLRVVLSLQEHSHAMKSPYIAIDITTMAPMMKYASSSDMPGRVTELRGRHFTMPVLFAVKFRGQMSQSISHPSSCAVFSGHG